MIIKRILEKLYSNGEIHVKQSGVIEFIDKRKRGRIRHKEFQRPLSFRIKTLRKLCWLANEFHKANINFRSLDRPLLVEVIRRSLECDRHSAYEYADALLFLQQRI